MYSAALATIKATIIIIILDSVNLALSYSNTTNYYTRYLIKIKDLLFYEFC